MIVLLYIIKNRELLEIKHLIIETKILIEHLKNKKIGGKMYSTDSETRNLRERKHRESVQANQYTVNNSSKKQRMGKSESRIFAKTTLIATQT